MVKLIFIPAAEKTIQRQFAAASGTCNKHPLRSESRSHTCKARATGGESLGVPPSHDCKREVAVDE